MLPVQQKTLINWQINPMQKSQSQKALFQQSETVGIFGASSFQWQAAASVSAGILPAQQTCVAQGVLWWRRKHEKASGEGWAKAGISVYLSAPTEALEFILVNAKKQVTSNTTVFALS